MEIKRSEIWLVNLISGCENELKGKHPCIVLSNSKICLHSSLLNIIPITSKKDSSSLSHIKIGCETGLDKESIAVCEQTKVVSREEFLYKIGEISNTKMMEIRVAINRTLGFDDSLQKEAGRLMREIQELDRFLIKYNDLEILHEREDKYKYLIKFCKDNDITVNFNKLNRRIE